MKILLAALSTTLLLTMVTGCRPSAPATTAPNQTTSTSQPSPDAGTSASGTSASGTSDPGKPSSSNSRPKRSQEVEDTVAKLTAMKKRQDAAKDDSQYSSERKLLAKTAKALLKALLDEDPSAYQPFIMSDETARKFFKTTAPVLLPGRVTTNTESRRNLRAWVGGRNTETGGVVVSKLTKSGNTLVCNTLTVPYTAGSLTGELKIMRAAQTPDGWRFLRFTPSHRN